MARTIDDACDDWVYFAAKPLHVREMSDWCTVKAMEIGWDFYELVHVLFEVQKPTWAAEDAEPRSN